MSSRSRLPLLLLVFDLFDKLVERFHHALLDATGRGAGKHQVEPPADVPHPAGNVIQRVKLEPRYVGPQQPGEPGIAEWNLRLPFKQSVERLRRSLPGEQPVLAAAAVEEERSRVDGCSHVEVGQEWQGLVESILAD